MIFPDRAFFVRDFQTIDRHACEEEKTAGQAKCQLFTGCPLRIARTFPSIQS
jgi:hypothetical protein